MTGTRYWRSKWEIAKMAEPPVCNVILWIEIGQLVTHPTAGPTSFAFIFLIIGNVCTIVTTPETKNSSGNSCPSPPNELPSRSGRQKSDYHCQFVCLVYEGARSIIIAGVSILGS